MGLDLTILGKPKEGHEQEFEQIWAQLNAANGAAPASDLENKGFFGRLAGFMKKPADNTQLIERFNEIMVPAYEGLRAPVVGCDKLADEWVLEQHKAAAQATTPEQALADMQGYHVIQLLDDCDGFPIYTHAYGYEGVDRTSFRGKFLESCDDVIGQKLIDQAWVSMLAVEFSQYGCKLRECADKYAQANGVSHVLGDKYYEWSDENAPDTKAHIVDQAARWCIYWSSRGHGCEPFY